MIFNGTIAKLLKKQAAIDNLLTDYRNMLTSLDHNGLKSYDLSSKKVDSLIQESFQVDLKIGKINNMLLSNVNMNIDGKLHSDLKEVIDFAKNIHKKFMNTQNLRECIIDINQFNNSLDKFLDAYSPIVHTMQSPHIKKPSI